MAKRTLSTMDRRRAIEIAIRHSDGINVPAFALVFDDVDQDTIRNDMAFFESEGYEFEEVTENIWGHRRTFHRAVREPSEPIYGCQNPVGSELWEEVEWKLFRNPNIEEAVANWKALVAKWKEQLPTPPPDENSGRS